MSRNLHKVPMPTVCSAHIVSKGRKPQSILSLPAGHLTRFGSNMLEATGYTPPPLLISGNRQSLASFVRVVLTHCRFSWSQNKVTRKEPVVSSRCKILHGYAVVSSKVPPWWGNHNSFPPSLYFEALFFKLHHVS